MTDETPGDEAPDWSRLPRDPVGFFALPEGFDRKELKRSYNRLLRLYKPEKHPEEFQRIRAAYEDLERQLRYGAAPTLPAPRGSWSAAAERKQGGGPAPSSAGPTPTGPKTPSEDSSGPIDLEALADRLQSGDASIAGEYAKLSKRPHKTPPDYYALALMGDAVGPTEKRLFLQWLLVGIKEWPGDAALSQLVDGYLRTQASLAELPTLLLAVSKAAPNDSFYRLTEGGWDRLLREGNFGRFVKTLRRCEENLAGDPEIAGRVAFYIHALRFALWDDPSGWKDQTQEFVEEHFDQAPSHLENDFDALMIVREYLTHRAEFVASHPVCERLDNVLKIAFTRDQLEADRAMAECQRWILAHPDEVAEAFPAVESPACQAFYPLWAWMSEDSASRIAPPDEDAKDFRLWRERIQQMLAIAQAKKSLATRWWTVVGISRWVISALVLLVIIVACGTGALLLFITPIEYYSLHRNIDAALTLCGLAALIAISVVVYRWWKWWPGFIDRKLWHPFCRRMAERCYKRLWRPEVFAFMRRSVLDFFTFRALVAEDAQVHLDERTWIAQFVQQDFGLAVYSLAQRYQE